MGQIPLQQVVRIVGFIIDNFLEAVAYLQQAGFPMRYVMIIVFGRDDVDAKTVCLRAASSTAISERVEPLDSGSLV